MIKKALWDGPLVIILIVQTIFLALYLYFVTFRVMGINALYCKPNLSQANQAHRKYPYLLKGLAIQRSNQVLFKFPDPPLCSAFFTATLSK